MSNLKIIKRLVACFGSIQLITALSVLDYREVEKQEYREKEQQELNIEYENHLVITPLWAPEGQVDEFVAFIQKMATSMRYWKNITYISHEQTISISKTLNSLGLLKGSSRVHELLGITNPNELYLAREWRPENQILLNVYASAEKICYGDGIGIYFSQSTFSSPSSSKNTWSYLSNTFKSIKEKIKTFRSQPLIKEDFDVGYFSLPSAFGELPPMKTVILDETVYLRTFQSVSERLGSIVKLSYINNLRSKLKSSPVSIILTSNFSEASGRMSLENEVSAYKEFLQMQNIPNNSVILIKPHPRDSREKIHKLQSAIEDLCSEIVILNEGDFFYLPFEVFFMEVFLKSDVASSQNINIFTFSSACLTLKFLFDAQCIIGFGSDIVEKFFYKDHVIDRIKHEADLLSAVKEIETKRNNTSVSSENSLT